MTRGRGLRNIDNRHQIAHAIFSIFQEMQNSEPRPVGKSPKLQVGAHVIAGLIHSVDYDMISRVGKPLSQLKAEGARFGGAQPHGSAIFFN